MTHEDYMRYALELAERGRGKVLPNPMVGCVVVKDGIIISEGCHEKVGEYHAERNALLRCPEDPKGADLYVTLEPCCHYGRTPPCTEIIIEKGIKRVFVASMDPNPLVAGKGVEILREAGIEVETGILEAEALKLNEEFFWFITHNTPFVALKYAMSLDGKIACHTGDSKWITGETARDCVQNLRRNYAGIMAGIGTVLADDPMLNCRKYEGCNPVRIILDSTLRIPEASQIVKTACEIDTIVYCTEETFERAKAKVELLKNAGISVEAVAEKGGRPDISEVLENLGKRKIASVLVEGGASVNASLVENRLVQKVYTFVGNSIIGGHNAPSPVAGEGADTMATALTGTIDEVKTVGKDVLIVSYPDRR